MSTNMLKKRHSGHKQEIKKQIGGLGHHYGGPQGCKYESISIQIIDQVEQGDPPPLTHQNKNGYK